ncbi:uncharacterized protein LOC142238402 [Haematobia irritans]|uniref:uncharacterized protein LOC142238402 n=1 Tax=Haematobia irritans TaxID=7368 RepID=UPI003F50D08D
MAEITPNSNGSNCGLDQSVRATEKQSIMSAYSVEPLVESSCIASEPNVPIAENKSMDLPPCDTSDFVGLPGPLLTAEIEGEILGPPIGFEDSSITSLGSINPDKLMKAEVDSIDIKNFPTPDELDKSVSLTAENKNLDSVTSSVASASGESKTIEISSIEEKSSEEKIEIESQDHSNIVKDSSKVDKSSDKLLENSSEVLKNNSPQEKHNEDFITPSDEGNALHQSVRESDIRIATEDSTSEAVIEITNEQALPCESPKSTEEAPKSTTGEVPLPSKEASICKDEVKISELTSKASIIEETTTAEIPTLECLAKRASVSELSEKSSNVCTEEQTNTAGANEEATQVIEEKVTQTTSSQSLVTSEDTAKIVPEATQPDSHSENATCKDEQTISMMASDNTKIQENIGNVKQELEKVDDQTTLVKLEGTSLASQEEIKAPEQIEGITSATLQQETPAPSLAGDISSSAHSNIVQSNIPVPTDINLNVTETSSETLKEPSIKSPAIKENQGISSSSIESIIEVTTKEENSVPISDANVCHTITTKLTEVSAAESTSDSNDPKEDISIETTPQIPQSISNADSKDDTKSTTSKEDKTEKQIASDCPGDSIENEGDKTHVQESSNKPTSASSVEAGISQGGNTKTTDDLLPPSEANQENNSTPIREDVSSVEHVEDKDDPLNSTVENLPFSATAETKNASKEIASSLEVTQPKIENDRGNKESLAHVASISEVISSSEHVEDKDDPLNATVENLPSSSTVEPENGSKEITASVEATQAKIEDDIGNKESLAPVSTKQSEITSTSVDLPQEEKKSSEDSAEYVLPVPTEEVASAEEPLKISMEALATEAEVKLENSVNNVKDSAETIQEVIRDDGGSTNEESPFVSTNPQANQNSKDSSENLLPPPTAYQCDNSAAVQEEGSTGNVDSTTVVVESLTATAAVVSEIGVNEVVASVEVAQMVINEQNHGTSTETMATSVSIANPQEVLPEETTKFVPVEEILDSASCATVLLKAKVEMQSKDESSIIASQGTRMSSPEPGSNVTKPNKAVRFPEDIKANISLGKFPKEVKPNIVVNRPPIPVSTIEHLPSSPENEPCNIEVNDTELSKETQLADVTDTLYSKSSESNAENTTKSATEELSAISIESSVSSSIAENTSNEIEPSTMTVTTSIEKSVADETPPTKMEPTIIPTINKESQAGILTEPSNSAQEVNEKSCEQVVSTTPAVCPEEALQTVSSKMEVVSSTMDEHSLEKLQNTPKTTEEVSLIDKAQGDVESTTEDSKGSEKPIDQKPPVPAKPLKDAISMVSMPTPVSQKEEVSKEITNSDVPTNVERIIEKPPVPAKPVKHAISMVPMSTPVSQKEEVSKEITNSGVPTNAERIIEKPPVPEKPVKDAISMVPMPPFGIPAQKEEVSKEITNSDVPTNAESIIEKPPVPAKPLKHAISMVPVPTPVAQKKEVSLEITISDVPTNAERIIEKPPVPAKPLKHAISMVPMPTPVAQKEEVSLEIPISDVPTNAEPIIEKPPVPGKPLKDAISIVPMSTPVSQKEEVSKEIVSHNVVSCTETLLATTEIEHVEKFPDGIVTVVKENEDTCAPTIASITCAEETLIIDDKNIPSALIQSITSAEDIEGSAVKNTDIPVQVDEVVTTDSNHIEPDKSIKQNGESMATNILTPSIESKTSALEPPINVNQADLVISTIKDSEDTIPEETTKTATSTTEGEPIHIEQSEAEVSKDVIPSTEGISGQLNIGTNNTIIGQVETPISSEPLPMALENVVERQEVLVSSVSETKETATQEVETNNSIDNKTENQNKTIEEGLPSILKEDDQKPEEVNIENILIAPPPEYGEFVETVSEEVQHINTIELSENELAQKTDVPSTTLIETNTSSTSIETQTIVQSSHVGDEKEKCPGEDTTSSMADIISPGPNISPTQGDVLEMQEVSTSTTTENMIPIEHQPSENATPSLSPDTIKNAAYPTTASQATSSEPLTTEPCNNEHSDHSETQATTHSSDTSIKSETVEVPSKKSSPVETFPRKSPHFNNAVIFITSSNQQIIPQGGTLSIVSKSGVEEAVFQTIGEPLNPTDTQIDTEPNATQTKNEHVSTSLEKVELVEEVKSTSLVIDKDPVISEKKPVPSPIEEQITETQAVTVESQTPTSDIGSEQATKLNEVTPLGTDEQNTETIKAEPISSQNGKNTIENIQHITDSADEIQTIAEPANTICDKSVTASKAIQSNATQPATDSVSASLEKVDPIEGVKRTAEETNKDQEQKTLPTPIEEQITESQVVTGDEVPNVESCQTILTIEAPEDQLASHHEEIPTVQTNEINSSTNELCDKDISEPSVKLQNVEVQPGAKKANTEQEAIPSIEQLDSNNTPTGTSCSDKSISDQVTESSIILEKSEIPTEKTTLKVELIPTETKQETLSPIDSLHSSQSDVDQSNFKTPLQEPAVSTPAEDPKTIDSQPKDNVASIVEKETKKPETVTDGSCDTHSVTDSAVALSPYSENQPLPKLQSETTTVEQETEVNLKVTPSTETSGETQSVILQATIKTQNVEPAEETEDPKSTSTHQEETLSSSHIDKSVEVKKEEINDSSVICQAVETAAETRTNLPSEGDPKPEEQTMDIKSSQNHMVEAGSISATDSSLLLEKVETTLESETNPLKEDEISTGNNPETALSTEDIHTSEAQSVTNHSILTVEKETETLSSKEEEKPKEPGPVSVSETAKTIDAKSEADTTKEVEMNESSVTTLETDKTITNEGHISTDSHQETVSSINEVQTVDVHTVTDCGLNESSIQLDNVEPVLVTETFSSTEEEKPKEPDPVSVSETAKTIDTKSEPDTTCEAKKEETNEASVATLETSKTISKEADISTNSHQETISSISGVQTINVQSVTVSDNESSLNEPSINLDKVEPVLVAETVSSAEEEKPKEPDPVSVSETAKTIDTKPEADNGFETTPSINQVQTVDVQSGTVSESCIQLEDVEPVLVTETPISGNEQKLPGTHTNVVSPSDNVGAVDEIKTTETAANMKKVEPALESEQATTLPMDTETTIVTHLEQTILTQSSDLIDKSPSSEGMDHSTEIEGNLVPCSTLPDSSESEVKNTDISVNQETHQENIPSTEDAIATNVDLAKLQPFATISDESDNSSTYLILPPPHEFSDDDAVGNSNQKLKSLRFRESHISKTISMDSDIDVYSTPPCQTPLDVSVTENESNSTATDNNIPKDENPVVVEHSEIHNQTPLDASVTESESQITVESNSTAPDNNVPQDGNPVVVEHSEINNNNIVTPNLTSQQ